VSLALEERPQELDIGDSGGGPARRAIFRWSWRLYRREWRQQVLVVALMVFAVAATTVGVALVYNAGIPLDPQMGSATNSMTFVGADRADVTAAQHAFGAIEEIDHQSIAIPGTLSTIDLRAEDPNGTYGHPTLRLVSGRFPTGAGDIAMTRDAAAVFNVHIGDQFVANAATRHVVGIVENPLDLNDEFALVAPGGANPPDQVTILFDAPARVADAFNPTGNMVGNGSRSTLNKTTTAVVVLALETIGLLFVGLVAAAGFTVMAQRRLRAQGCWARSARPTPRFASRWLRMEQLSGSSARWGARSWASPPGSRSRPVSSVSSITGSADSTCSGGRSRRQWSSRS
jgi:putative ABC transport system permease protein